MPLVDKNRHFRKPGIASILILLRVRLGCRDLLPSKALRRISFYPPVRYRLIGDYTNLDYTQLSVDYWAQIGVDVEIDQMEWAVLAARANTHTYEGMTWGNRGASWPPLSTIRTVAHSDSIWNLPGVQDPVYDAMVEAAENAGSTEEMMELVNKADMYFSEQQWTTWGPMRPSFIFWQPWMVGYNGELSIGGGRHWLYLSRVWLDSDLREEMTGTR